MKTAWAAYFLAACCACLLSMALVKQRMARRTELADIFQTLHEPVRPRSVLPESPVYANFVADGSWKDSLVQKRQRLVAEEQALEVKIHAIC